MKPVLIFRHVDCEGPGYLAGFLEGQGVPWQLVRVDAGEPVPAEPGTASGLVFMGGPMSVNDPLEWIDAELALINKALEARIPVLGHCLGGQLLARALGASIRANPVREIGWHPVTRYDTPEAIDWFGPESSFECFHWHGESFSLPQGAEPLLRSDFFDNQAFAYGNSLALQCHVEMTPDMIRTWSERFADQLTDPSESVQTPAQMLEEVEARAYSLNRVADRVYSRWLRDVK